MNRRSVPLTRPWTGSEEVAALARVVESGWWTQGPSVAEFERLVAAAAGEKHAVAFTSCTTALHVALLLHEIGPGDEVIVPSYTWIATHNSVRMTGATPVFVDIDLDTFNIDPEGVEAAITPRTRAIMPVHQFGMPVDLDAIAEIARRCRLIIIEDAACALGSRYKDSPIGSAGHTTCFSFHPRKLISTGEGGMLVTDDDALAARARVLINHGASVSDLAKHRAGTVEALLAEEFHEVGYNYRMTNLQGALGVVQMGRLEETLRLRAVLARRYSEGLASIPHITPPPVPDYASPNWQSYAIRIDEGSPISRNSVAQTLLDRGVACRPAYMACHLQPVYRASRLARPLVNTRKVLEQVIILPLFPQMSDEDQYYVINSLRNTLSG